MKTEAERKALQRQGWRGRTVWTHTATLVSTLLAEGLITDAQLEDHDAIDEALGQFVMQHCKVGRILRDNATERTVKEQKRPKAKSQKKSKHGHVKQFSKEEIADYESRNFNFSSGMPTYHGFLGFHNKGFGANGEDGIFGLDPLPPDWSERGKRRLKHYTKEDSDAWEEGDRGKNGKAPLWYHRVQRL